jgi:hypothetical protein
MEYWLLIPGFTVGCIFGFAAGYWFKQGEVDRAKYDCKCREMELRELKGEVLNTTKNTALMRRWARGAR